MVKANQGEKVTKKPLIPLKTDVMCNFKQVMDSVLQQKNSTKHHFSFFFKNFRCVFIPVGLFLLSTIPLPSEGIRGK